MAMKQTQTKYFEFSDFGLDFSVASKNLFPDRFKKMLSLGYNEQTVSSVTVSGNQVTLTYGGLHNYVAGRVLKVNAPELLSINGGEFVIDSVTTNTVTMTIDDAPTLIGGSFTTHVASLGYDLVYEQPFIHVYKFKALDESELFLRLCFQSALAQKNTIQPCVGRTVDLLTGDIIDPFVLEANKSVQIPGDGFRWDFTSSPNSTQNNYTFVQGVGSFGKAYVIGSPYHLLILSSTGGSYRFLVTGMLPVYKANLTGLVDLPSVVMLGHTFGLVSSVYSDIPGKAQQAYLGALRVNFTGSHPYEGLFKSYDILGTQPYYPENVENFNTQPAEPVMMFEHENKMMIGAVYGVYHIKLGTIADIDFTLQSQPVETFDIDLQNKCLLHSTSTRANSSFSSKLCIPIEEIKI